MNTREVVEAILHDCRISSRTVDAIRHKRFKELTKESLPEMFSMLHEFQMGKHGPSPHLMTMIWELLVDKGPTIPPEERGVVRKMADRLLAWGKEHGYFNG